MIFSFTVPTCPTVLSLFQSPMILFPLTGPLSALLAFSCSHMSPPEMPCISSVNPPSPADKQALAPHCLQVKTKRLCLALKFLSEPTVAQPSGISPPFGSNWVAWIACLMPSPYSSEPCNLFTPGLFLASLHHAEQENHVLVIPGVENKQTTHVGDT